MNYLYRWRRFRNNLLGKLCNLLKLMISSPFLIGLYFIELGFSVDEGLFGWLSQSKRVEKIMVAETKAVLKVHFYQ